MKNKRPSIALCCIAKNEAANLNKLTKSVDGCFDALYLTDTGSTDNTVALAKELGWQVSHFEWVEDFAKARNFNFSQAKEDYIMWLDLDDVLTGREAFIEWRNNAMLLNEFWLATYDYAHRPDGSPAVSFIRERVVKNYIGVERWRHFLHEGMPANKSISASCVPSNVWKVSHQRTTEDLAKDKGRNIRIFEKHMTEGLVLDTRMKFYYGKELFEIQRPEEAIKPLLDAASSADCEQHDRILAMQYAGFACMAAAGMLNPQNTAAKEKADKLFIDAIRIAHQGLNIDQHRAEFWTIIGDSYVKLQKIKEAIPFFAAAMRCEPLGLPGSTFSSPVFSFVESSTTYPRNQLIRCYFALNQPEKAKEMAIETQKLYPNEETKKILEEIEKISIVQESYQNAEENEDIVFTCPPVGMYEWDEEIYKTKGMGGSETACIEMAKLLREKTGRHVIVFNNRNSPLTASSGVEYRPSAEVMSYMSKHKPKAHIAWRHNLKCTSAKTYLWCHDLYTPGVESQHNFDKQICLSEFHRDYVHAMQGLPKDKIWISRNGIVPERFQEKHMKNPMKLVYPSSPDRGLEQLIPILDLVRKKHPVTLDVFYGFENLYKSGPHMSALADNLREMISTRPWIKYHGNTEQKELTKHLLQASIWCHPANFIESYCITAIEMLAAGVYPITRSLGALQNTLGPAKETGMAHLFEVNSVVVPESEYQMWADKVCEAIDGRYWERMNADLNQMSWGQVTNEWIQEMGL